MLNNNNLSSFNLKELNEQQLIAVKHTEGPLLVLAGAGTGKTKVLTSRIVHIINSYLAYPSEILAVTFTNKAAFEMKKRIGNYIGDQVNEVWVGTFHAIAARILRVHANLVGLNSDFTIIDYDDQSRLLKQILTDRNIDTKNYPIKNYINAISRVKDNAASGDVEKNSQILPEFISVMNSYNSKIRSMNTVDFGDLLMLNLDIFKNNPEVLANYQKKFRYILIDEYQDTNSCQYKWLLELSKKYRNICCVGDDDQSIYSWRGADINNILRFEKDFEEIVIDGKKIEKAKVVRLEQNYRSTSEILNVANSIISKNIKRHQKKLWTDLSTKQKVQLSIYDTDREESWDICKIISNQNKFNYSKIAILVRAGYQTRNFEESFIQNSIPYRVIGGLKFYDRLEIKDVIAYLRLVANIDDDLAFLRIINVPKRGIGSATIKSISDKAAIDNNTLFKTTEYMLNAQALKGKLFSSFVEFINMIKSWQEKVNEITLSSLVEIIVNETGYIQNLKIEKTPESQGRIENIQEFIRTIDEFSSLTEFLEYVRLVESSDDVFNKEMVNIMTIHGAKGLEFDMVFVPGLEDGVFPSSKSMDEPGGVEEERRLFYVAITRAKRELFLSCCKSRYIYGDIQQSIISRFVKDIPENEIEVNARSRSNNIYRDNYSGNYKESLYSTSYKNSNTLNNSSDKNIYENKKSEKSSKIKQKVFHQKFGHGIVISEEKDKVEVLFDKMGKKIIVKDFLTFYN